MAEGVLVVDVLQTIIFINKPANRFFYLRSKPLGHSLSDAVYEENLLYLLQTMLKQNERVVVEDFTDSLIPHVFYSYSVHPLVKEGSIVGSIIIASDISDKKEIEHKQKQLESIQALTALTAGVAHEIKNPLGAMSIHAQLMSQELKSCNCPQKDDLHYSLTIVHDEIERLNSIVVNFLYSVRPMKLNLNLLPLGSFLDSIFNLCVLEMNESEIQFIKDYDELPAVWLDENSLKQALINLLQNSKAAMKEDKDKQIVLQASVDEQWAYVRIKDNGEGIPENLKSKIFDPYFTTKSYGSGLGLTIVYRIIHKHRGNLDFSSANNETIFTINFFLSPRKND